MGRQSRFAGRGRSVPTAARQRYLDQKKGPLAKKDQMSAFPLFFGMEPPEKPQTFSEYASYIVTLMWGIIKLWVMYPIAAYHFGFGVVLYFMACILNELVGVNSPYRPWVGLGIILAGYFHFCSGKALAAVPMAGIKDVPYGGEFNRQARIKLLDSLLEKNGFPESVKEEIRGSYGNMMNNYEERFFTGNFSRAPTLYDSPNIFHLGFSHVKNDVPFNSFFGYYSIYDTRLSVVSPESVSMMVNGTNFPLPNNTTSVFDPDMANATSATSATSATNATEAPTVPPVAVPQSLFATIFSPAVGPRITFMGTLSAWTYLAINTAIKYKEQKWRYERVVHQLDAATAELKAKLINLTAKEGDRLTDPVLLREIGDILYEIEEIEAEVKIFKSAINVKKKQSWNVSASAFLAPFTSMANLIDTLGRMLSLLPLVAYLFYGLRTALAQQGYGGYFLAVLGNAFLIPFGWQWRRTISSVIAAPYRLLDKTLFKWNKRRTENAARLPRGGTDILDNLPDKDGKYRKEVYEPLLKKLKESQSPQEFIDILWDFSLDREDLKAPLVHKRLSQMCKELTATINELGTAVEGYAELDDQRQAVKECMAKLNPLPNEIDPDYKDKTKYM